MRATVGSNRWVSESETSNSPSGSPDVRRIAGASAGAQQQAERGFDSESEWEQGAEGSGTSALAGTSESPLPCLSASRLSVSRFSALAAQQPDLAGGLDQRGSSSAVQQADFRGDGPRQQIPAGRTDWRSSTKPHVLATMVRMKPLLGLVAFQVNAERET